MVQYNSAAIFQALGDSTRLSIVDQLTRGPRRLSDLRTPDPMSFQALRKHVQVLEKAAVIRSRKQGRERVCELNPAALERSSNWLSDRKITWEQRLDRLQSYFDMKESP